jgi:hypothetical protein
MTDILKLNTPPAAEPTPTTPAVVLAPTPVLTPTASEVVVVFEETIEAIKDETIEQVSEKAGLTADEAKTLVAASAAALSKELASLKGLVDKAYDEAKTAKEGFDKSHGSLSERIAALEKADKEAGKKAAEKKPKKADDKKGDDTPLYKNPYVVVPVSLVLILILLKVAKSYGVFGAGQIAEVIDLAA